MINCKDLEHAWLNDFSLTCVILLNYQDLYNLSIQFNDLKLLLYSNIGIALGNRFINVTQRSLSKRCYLSFKIKNQKIEKENHVMQIILFP